MEPVNGKADKTKKRIRLVTGVVFPLLLFLYPLLLVNQGVDITDTTYSLGYYRFMDRMDMTWVLATYLANCAGFLLMKLPMGDTLLFMNLYTGLIVSGLALTVYFMLIKRLPGPAVFAGEIIALSLCWCPTTILYNYLTYLLFTLGALFLYRGIVRDRGRDYVLAGIFLGLNVMVRFPNLLEAALIAAVWFGCWLQGRGFMETLRRTGLCVAGYLAGIGSVLLVITLRYGAGAFPAMVGGLFGMTKEASDYTFTGMLSDILSAYGTGLKWTAYMLPCMALGFVLFRLGKGKWEKIKRAVYVLGIAVLLRLYWGRGMFTFRYYDYECVFQWMMLFLLLSLGLCIADVGGFLTKDRDTRILAAIVLTVIVITPFGSNNYTWQNMNNLFLVAPYTVWACFRLLKRTGSRAVHFPWQAFVATVLLLVTVQGLGFGFTYVFRDGTAGEKRDTPVKNSRVLKGMYTTKENADSLSELIGFCDAAGISNAQTKAEGCALDAETEGNGSTASDRGSQGAASEGNVSAQTSQGVLFWGDAPGLSYLLDVPSAIFTTWPEIPSSTYGELEKALKELTFRPPVILHNDTGKAVIAGDKTDLIFDYLKEHDYERVFVNANYQVYLAANGWERARQEPAG